MTGIRAITSQSLAVALLVAGCAIAPVNPSGTGPALTGPSVAPLSPSPSASLASPGVPCPVTPFETIPPNDVVEWDQPIWQPAAEGLWAHPYLSNYTTRSGFTTSPDDLKILWWILDGGKSAPVALRVTSLPAGFSAEYSFEAPGPDRRDRPSGFVTPPPGCYEINITIGTQNGVVVDQVLPPD
jgi:hypothetical protein